VAKKFSFSQIIKTGDARQRILLIVVVVLVFVLVLFLLSKLIHIGTNSTGNSRVSGVPSISSVQGGKVSPEYARALNNSNVQKADYAKSTGTSTIPTLINTGVNDIVSTQIGCTNCCNTCGSESTDQMLGALLNSGKISSSTADLLNSLASQNLSPEDYEAALARMVREGKISPEEARKLLAAYKQNYQDKIAAAGAADLDPLVKESRLSVSAASNLLELQKQPASLSAYEQALAAMVNQGKMTSDTAKLLLQKYQKQQQKRQAEESAGQLASMEASGSLSHDTAAMLAALQASGLSPTDYAAALDKLVKEGKLTPEEARRLLEQYNKQHGISGAGLEQGLSGMELSKEQGDALRELQRTNQPVAVFSAKLEQYARASEISADTASRLLTAYQEEYNAKQAGDTAKAKLAADLKDQLITRLESKPKLPSDIAQQLNSLCNNSVPTADYASELQRLVDASLISSETAKTLLTTCNQQLAKNGFSTDGRGAAFSGLSSPAIDINLLGGSSGNPKLDRVSQAGLAQQSTQAQQRKDYTAAVAFQQKDQQTAMAQQAQVQALSDQMYAQAQQLFAPILTPPVQTVVMGDDSSSASAGGAGSVAAGEQVAGVAPIIKAGAVLYAVLDTAIDSDYPDSPVMATIVSGEFKGAKVLGSIKTVKGGQRVMLTFNLMTMNDWPTGATVNAFAIDPDSARSAVATSVDNHYMLRYGTAFAASFLQGLGQAVADSGTTVSSDSGVVTESTADLNTQETILVALGQVGQNASGEVGRLQNTPPTVKVKAGMGIGILFMGDVSAVKGAPATAQNLE
jgi:uncharacterized protein YutE (UPF0331/DUF86 family)